VNRAFVPNYSAQLEPASLPALAPECLEESTRKPIIEIKPFKNLGGDRSNFVAEALTEEIGLVLSRLSGSITMTLDYSKSVPDYVMRGTVQREDRHLRITAQLISSSDGKTIWADRFTGEIGSSFDFQDQIARDIVSALQLVLTEGEQAQLWRRATTSGEAWEAFQQGHDYVRRFTREGHWRAKNSYTHALSIDPDYLSALVALGFCHLDEMRLGWSNDPARSLVEASNLANRAAVIAERHPDVLALNSYVKFFEGNRHTSLELINQAVAEAPHSSEIIAYKGALHDLMGQFEEAIEAYRNAISKSLFSPAWIAANLALTLLAMNRNLEAEQVFNKVLRNHPKYARAWIGLTVAYVRQGRLEEAQDCARRLQSLDPKFSVEEWASSKPFSEERILEGFKSDLVTAGLP
jgi:TolB-like protein